MKKKLTQLCLLFVTITALSALDQLSVPLNDPVYHLIEQGRIRKLFPSPAYVKPYSYEQVKDLLNSMFVSGGLNSQEKGLVKEHLLRLDPRKDEPLLKTGRLSLPGSEISEMQIGASFETSLNVSTDDPDNYDQRNLLTLVLEGGLTQNFSYRMNAGGRYDKLSSTAWAPYEFSSPGEGFYISYDEDSPIGYSDGENSDHSSSYYTTPEMAVSLIDDHLFLRWGMIERDWGMGEGNIHLSDTARSFDALEGTLTLSPMFNLSFLTGTLTDWEEDDEFQNMFTTKRMEFHLPWGLEFAVSESVVWVKRFEMGYLNPVMVTTIYQNTLGNYDNMYMGLDFAWNFMEGYQVYGNYTADEMRNYEPDNWFKEVRNIFALQGGFRGSIPVLPFTSVNLQYTRLEPFFYTHYPQKYPSYSDDDDDIETRMLTYYSNKGENLGYKLAPDSDELLLKVSSSAISNLFLEFSWSYITHSDQFGTSITDSIDYDLYEEGGYDQKNRTEYLIEKVHTLALDGKWNLENFPVTLTGGYALVTGKVRESSSEDWDNYFNNIFSIGAEFYY